MNRNNTYPRENKYDVIDQVESELNQVNEEESYYGDSSERDILDDLSPDQLRDLEESIAEGERGETVPIEEIFEMLKGWKEDLKRQIDLE